MQYAFRHSKASNVPYPARAETAGRRAYRHDRGVAASPAVLKHGNVKLKAPAWGLDSRKKAHIPAYAARRVEGCTSSLSPRPERVSCDARK